MSEVGKLTVTTRSTSGKGPARQLRAAGLVPGVLYGATAAGRLEPRSIVVDVKALKASLDPVRKQNTVIDLTVEGEGGIKVAALLRDYQLDPIRREVTHVDLVAIDPAKEVVAEVPLEFVGKHAGAIDGGQLHTVLRSLQIRSKPADIPVNLTVDISPLAIGDVLHVSDIKLPVGVVSVTGLDQAVISCTPPEVEKAAATTEAAAAPAADAKAAAPAAKAPAGGKAAAPAAGGKAAPAAPAAKGGKK
jgi:large subunit ribosomal protein L25